MKARRKETAKGRRHTGSKTQAVDGHSVRENRVVLVGRSVESTSPLSSATLLWACNERQLHLQDQRMHRVISDIEREARMTIEA